ncbi:UDP-N-acetylmuramate--L-alanine ligase [Flavobacteriaceae bacterium Ap0902]|nr:UDP-N-acetylmuramate--L-alanine ligase [Flavobacteriaceae bacterium Ap0902]
MNINQFTYYYFIGIGGIGMSAVARYFHQMNKKVMGYDKTSTTLTKLLTKEGIKIHFEDTLEAIPKALTPDNTLVIYTPAIPKNHLELNYFKDNNYNIIKRSEALGYITQETTCLAVAGTHGKTTTSSLLGHILKVANLPSTAFLGGIVENYNSNIIIGGNEISVVEADEFDRSFLQLSPDYACITSMDADHLDIYGDQSEMEKSFLEFASIVKKQVFAKTGLNVPGALSYGVEEKADYFADNIQIKADYFIFDLTHPQGKIETIPMHLPGRHNIENAVGAIAMAMKMNVAENKIKEALDSFQGIKRRFTRHKTSSGKIIIDDYAHHPTELNAIIRATQNFYPNKSVTAVFQPHLFSRTRDFLDDFAQSLAVLEDLIILEIYPAREEPIPGITSSLLAEKIELINDKKPKVCSLENALREISHYDNDIILLMGAGNIDTLYEPLKNKIQ